MNSSLSLRIPPIFISHGGGPMPLLNDPSHAEMIKHAKEVPKIIPKPKAILVVSAHWEEKSLTILETIKPNLLFDYYGFPEESYKYKYDCPSASELNEKLKLLLNNAGIQYKSEKKRGFDHGVFVPLMLMYPDADIPVSQISLISNLNPEEHMKIGQAISSLSDEGILILGSGFNYHNLYKFFYPSTDSLNNNRQFNNYLRDIFENENYSPEDRLKLLNEWKNAPGAIDCHPREEHLIPLMVIAGAANANKGIVKEFYMTEILALNILFM